MKLKSISKLTATASLGALPALAFAHLGNDAGLHHGTGFLAGFTHPLTGLDHLCAMIAVGIWSAMNTRRIWTVPISFAAVLLIGALAGMQGLTLPAVEPMIAASVLVLGLLVALRTKLPVAASAALIGVFAIFHGVAHGTELGGANSVPAAVSGMVLGTLLLHIVGLGIGHMLQQRSAWWPRALGGGVALLGIGFLGGLI
ncbi:MAG TPA: HupE/UreJ family protein [Rhodocyclaceae bacterium]|nr:HupE/UreJ family protein [Rhodocyclaceae bacterium]